MKNGFLVLTFGINILIAISSIFWIMYQIHLESIKDRVIIIRVVQSVEYINKTLDIFKEDLNSLHRGKEDKGNVQAGFKLVKQDERDLQSQINDIRKEVFDIMKMKISRDKERK